MISAQTTAGTVWGYSYGYDGFGNLSGKTVTKGSPAAGWAVGSDQATNHVYGYTYDANGNLTGSNTRGLLHTFDVENRLTAYVEYEDPETYGYDPSNKRIQKQLPDGT